MTVQGNDVDLKEVIISDSDATITVVMWGDLSATNVTVGDTFRVTSAKITLFNKKLQAQTTRATEIEVHYVIRKWCPRQKFTSHFVFFSVTHFNNVR